MLIKYNSLFILIGLYKVTELIVQIEGCRQGIWYELRGLFAFVDNGQYAEITAGVLGFARVFH